MISSQNERIQSAISISAAVDNLKQFFHYLKRKWLVLLLVGVIGGLLGIAWAWLNPNKFQAELTFSVEEEQRMPGGLLGLASSIGIELGGAGGAFSGDNLIEFLHSRTMLEKALLRPTSGPHSHYSLLNYFLDSVAKAKMPANNSYNTNRLRNSFSRAEDSLLKAAIGGINKTMLQVGKPDKKLSIIQVTCVSSKERFSKELVENLIDEAGRFYIETKTGKNRKNVELLQAKADSLSDAISGNISRRASISDANLNPVLQASTVVAQRSLYNISILTAAYSEVLKNLEMAKFNLNRETPLIQVIDRPIYPLENKKKGRLYGAIVFGFIAGLLALFFLYLRFSFMTWRMRGKWDGDTAAFNGDPENHSNE
jgi:hypothetical protein